MNQIEEFRMKMRARLNDAQRKIEEFSDDMEEKVDDLEAKIADIKKNLTIWMISRTAIGGSREMMLEKCGEKWRHI